MAIETTPLGFRKPDVNEPVSGGSTSLTAPAAGYQMEPSASKTWAASLHD
ncbi:hypothetical protein [Arthrobacter sp. NPDC058192]